ncbi:MAG: FAD-binding protein, partial [Calditrichaeota bacterium]
MLKKIQAWIEKILSSGTRENQRPILKKHNESNIPGLYIIGDLAGAPVIKLAMEQGYNVVNYIASLPDARSPDSSVYDLIVVGAGAAGLNAALTAKDKGLRCIVLEKYKIANTIENFPEGKWVYAEPDEIPPKGKLWLDGATKEDLIKRWHQIVNQNQLEVHTEEPLEKLEKQNGIFEVATPKATYKAKRIILATGQRGNPRKLNVPGEEREHVYHQLYSPRKYHNENILVVGGGNSAVEAALTLCEQNKVYLSYRGSEFRRLFKDNERLLNQKVAEGKIELILNSNVVEFGEKEATLKIDKGGFEETRKVPYQHAFVLIGAELPKAFLKSLGIRLENEWEGSFWRAVALTLGTLFGLWIFKGHPQLFGQDLSFLPAWLGALLALGSVATLVRFGFKHDRYAWLGL